MKKLLLSLGIVGLSGCTNLHYAPLYQAAGEIAVGPIQMLDVERNAGERRVAQRVDQALRRHFPAPVAPYRVDVTVAESRANLAVSRDTTVERQQITLTANLFLVDVASNEVVFTTVVSSSAAFNNEDTPFSTESGVSFARQTAADDLASEIVQRVWAQWARLQDAAEAARQTP